jgi:uncharacterized membrane protein YkvA (DUF1232 family)
MTTPGADIYQGLRAELRNQMKDTATGSSNKLLEYALMGPDLAHLLSKLMMEPEVPVGEKAKLAVALAYVVSPVDLLPAVLVGPVGWLEDIAIAAYVLNSLINKTNPELVTRHWAGEGDVLALIRGVLTFADQKLGGGFLRRVEGFFNF